MTILTLTLTSSTMMPKSEIKDGVFVDKENILEQMTEAHKKGLYTDITFTMSKYKVKISSSRFMLACRSSYFASMFFDESAYNRRRKKTTLLESDFDSKTMEKLLNFIWYGRVKFSDMDFQSLLNLLRVSMLIRLVITPSIKE